MPRGGLQRRSGVRPKRIPSRTASPPRLTIHRVAAAAAAADLEPPPLLIGRRSNAPRPTPPPRGRCASRSCLPTPTYRDGRSRRPARYALMCIARWTVAQPRHTCTVHELRVRVHTACVCAPHVHRMCTACAPHVHRMCTACAPTPTPQVVQHHNKSNNRKWKMFHGPNGQPKVKSRAVAMRVQYGEAACVEGAALVVPHNSSLWLALVISWLRHCTRDKWLSRS